MCKGHFHCHEVVLVGGMRTPIGDFLGNLSSVSAIELTKIAASSALERFGVSPEVIDEVTLGTVYKQGLRANPARQVQIALGIPPKGGAVTVEQQCASGMRALEIAMQQIQLGKTQAALVCGCESMSNVPFLNMNQRKGNRMGAVQVEDGLMYDALIDVFSDKHMALTAERVAQRYNITRQEQDELALLSQKRALTAINAGVFQQEIAPVTIKTRRGTEVVDRDEHPRETSLEALAKLRPVFAEEGTVTAGNASGINDGATALIIMSAERAEELNLKPLARILSSVTVGVEPEVMGIGPAYTIPEAVRLAGLRLDDIAYHEINEAFAAQCLACVKELGLDMDHVNANGSGISLGHPVGSTSLRLILTLAYELERRGERYGCASLCAGGGPGMSVVIEKL